MSDSDSDRPIAQLAAAKPVKPPPEPESDDDSEDVPLAAKAAAGEGGELQNSSFELHSVHQYLEQSTSHLGARLDGAMSGGVLLTPAAPHTFSSAICSQGQVNAGAQQGGGGEKGAC